MTQHDPCARGDGHCGPSLWHDLAIAEGQRQTDGLGRKLQIDIAPDRGGAAASDGFLAAGAR